MEISRQGFAIWCCRGVALHAEQHRFRVRSGYESCRRQDTSWICYEITAGIHEGENVAGDVVNTASRLQTAAPVGGVLVGEPTYRATSGAVQYEELEPVTAKGKAEPLRVWRPLGVRPLATAGERGHG